MTEAYGLVQIVEAALLAAGKPLTVAQLGALFEEHERPSNDDIRAALNEARERCEGRGYELVEVASGFRFQVREQFSQWVGRLWQERPQKYSRALLETLALIAYRQPITRGEIEEIRGVAVSTNIIRTLHERDWIRVVGHRDVPGRPSMYATTRQFLDYFNLKSLDQLPALADIRDLETLNAELGFSEPLEASAPDEATAGSDGDAGSESGTAAAAADAGTAAGADNAAADDAGVAAAIVAEDAVEAPGENDETQPSDNAAAANEPADAAAADSETAERDNADEWADERAGQSGHGQG